MIDHQRKLLFVHITRTGGTSIESALVGGDWWKIDPETKHLSASLARQHYGEEIWRTYTTFAVVRNPWDRLVSMWTIGYWYTEETHLRGAKPSSFEEFLRTLQPHPAEKHRTLHQHRILDEKIDFILRFENLQTEFSHLFRHLGLPDVNLPLVLPSDRRPYRDYYTTETAAAVAQTYATDIERYGYSF